MDSMFRRAKMRNTSPITSRSIATPVGTVKDPRLSFDNVENKLIADKAIDKITLTQPIVKNARNFMNECSIHFVADS